MNFALTARNCQAKTRHCVSKTRIFAFKIMDFAVLQAADEITALPGPCLRLSGQFRNPFAERPQPTDQPKPRSLAPLETDAMNGRSAGGVSKNDDFSSNTREVVSETRSFLYKTRNFVSKASSFVLKTMNFAGRESVPAEARG